jgi:hypothetical protein
MTPEGKSRRRRTRPESGAVWDLGGAFGASLRAWNQRREEVPGEPTAGSGEAPVAEPPRAMSSRTRGVRQ